MKSFEPEAALVKFFSFMGIFLQYKQELLLYATTPVVQLLPLVQLFATPGFPVLHCLLQFAQIHVH